VKTADNASQATESNQTQPKPREVKLTGHKNLAENITNLPDFVCRQGEDCKNFRVVKDGQYA